MATHNLHYSIYLYFFLSTFPPSHYLNLNLNLYLLLLAYQAAIFGTAIIVFFQASTSG